MHTVRTVVFPALRLLVWTVIAVALVVLAFRGGSGEAAPVSAGAPPVDLTSPVVPVARGTVANTVTVQGTVVADATVPVRATKAGTVRRVLRTPSCRSCSIQPLATQFLSQRTRSRQPRAERRCPRPLIGSSRA